MREDWGAVGIDIWQACIFWIELLIIG
jgi:hypothetical protein